MGLKYFLAQVLQQNEFPLLNSLIANYYPVFAESQIGALSPINYFFFRFFDFATAINLIYLLGFIFLSLTSYGLGNYLYKDRRLALFLALTFPLSAIVIQRVVHFNVLQAVFFIPAVFYTFLRGTREINLKYFALASFLAAQQLLFGHYFISFGTLFFLTLFFLMHLKLEVHEKNHFQKLFLYYFLFIFLLLSVALPQLIATIIFYANSNRAANLTLNLTASSFKLSQLLTFFHPFPFGSMKSGSFFQNASTTAHAAGPWEANIFLNYGFVFLCAWLLIRFFQRRLFLDFKNNRLLPFFALGTLVAFLMSLGLSTPLKFLYSLPIISGFRATARYSIFTSFFLSALLPFLLKANRLNKNLLYIACAVQIGSAVFFFGRYFPTTPANKIVSGNPIASYLGQKHLSAYTYGTQELWRKTFLRKGYAAEESYLKYLSAVYPHVNLFYNVRSCNYFEYSGFNLVNYANLNAFVTYHLDFDLSKGKLRSSTLTALQTLGCQALIVPQSVRNLKELFHYKEFKVYSIPTPLPKFGIYYGFSEHLSTLDYFEALEENKVDLNRLHLRGISLDSAKPTTKASQTLYASQQGTTEFEIDVHVKTNSAWLLARIVKYPGWSAVLDGKKKLAIREAFGTYMAVKIPPGQHKVVFKYHQSFWEISLLIMSLGYVIQGFLVFYKPRPNT
jgi:hypothetical protein